jgi:hypothetical protein
MKSKKKAVAKKSAHRPRKAADKKSTSLSAGKESYLSNGRRNGRARRKNTETAEERKKRHAEMEALTLRAFQIAYDNHHGRHSL